MAAMIGGCKEIQDEMIWQEIQEGRPPVQIAREYNVHPSTVHRIKHRREAENDGSKKREDN